MLDPAFSTTDTILANIEGAVNNLPSSSHSNNISSFEPKPKYLKFLQAPLGKNRIRSAFLKLKYD